MAGAGDRLLEVTRELLADHPPSALSGRQIAAAADVNYGRVHRHFGSKSALIDRAVQQLGERFTDDAFPPGALVPTPGVLCRHSSFAHAVAHLTVDDPRGAAGPVRMLVERYREGLAGMRPDLSVDQRDVIVILSVSMQWAVVIHRRHLERVASLAGGSVDVDRDLVLLVEQLHGGFGPFAKAPLPRELRAQSPVGSVDLGDSVERKLVYAAAELLANRAPTSVTGRELARHAGVNYGRIHSAFGTTANVFEAAIDMQAAQMLEDFGTDRFPGFFSMNERPGFVRFLTRMALADGHSSEREFFPFLSRLFAQHEARHGQVAVRTRHRYALSIMTQVSWALFEECFDDALGRPVDELEPQAAGYLTALVRNV